MDFDHIEKVMGRDEESIARFFVEIKDYYEWNSKYWAQRGLFESKRMRFADAIDFVDYASARDSHFTIRNSQGVVYLRASVSIWAGNFSKGKELFDKGIEIMDSVLKDRDFNSPKIFIVILKSIIKFVDYWGAAETSFTFDIFKNYMQLAKKQRNLKSKDLDDFRSIEGEMMKLRLELKKE